MINLDARDRAGLAWLEARARLWLVGFRRGRKKRPRGPFSPEELALLQAVVNIREAAGRRSPAKTGDRV